jgi:hypothetical protein
MTARVWRTSVLDNAEPGPPILERGIRSSRRCGGLLETIRARGCATRQAERELEARWKKRTACLTCAEGATKSP